MGPAPATAEGRQRLNEVHTCGAGMTAFGRQPSRGLRAIALEAIV